jgi:hypothetical protein
MKQDTYESSSLAAKLRDSDRVDSGTAVLDGDGRNCYNDATRSQSQALPS